MARGLLLVLLSFLAFFSSSVSAASTVANATEAISELSQIPHCALQCATLLPTSSCSLTDLTCFCTSGNPTNVTGSIQKCVLDSCTIRESLQVQKILEEICGVPVTREGGTVLAVTIAFTAVVFLTCLIRLGVRSRDWKLFGWDDAFIIMATLLCAPLAATVIMLVKSGLGTSLWGVAYEDLEGIFFWFWVSESLYSACLVLAKLSVLCFYMRVFTEPSFLWKTYVLMGLSVAFFVGTFFAFLFQCTPISFAWYGWDKLHTGHCINGRALLWAHSIINITLDGLIFLLPIPTLWRLTLPVLRKIGLLFIFSLGILTMVVAALRLKTFNNSFNDFDFTYELRLAAIWSVVEVCVGITCVCLPTIRPFFRAIKHFIFGEPPNDRYENSEIKVSGQRRLVTMGQSSAGSSEKSKASEISMTQMSRSGSTEGLYDPRYP